MAVPKQKRSRNHTRHRRSTWKTSPVQVVDCPNPACDAKVVPHRACSECGQYGGQSGRRQVL